MPRSRRYLARGRRSAGQTSSRDRRRCRLDPGCTPGTSMTRHPGFPSTVVTPTLTEPCCTSGSPQVHRRPMARRRAARTCTNASGTTTQATPLVRRSASRWAVIYPRRSESSCIAWAAELDSPSHLQAKPPCQSGWLAMLASPSSSTTHRGRLNPALSRPPAPR